jgi:hypothetical protein
VAPDAVIEVSREAADDGLVAGVGPTEAAAGEASEVTVGAHHDDGTAHLSGLDRGGHGGGGTPVDDKVVLDRDGGGKHGGSEEKGQEAGEG